MEDDHLDHGLSSQLIELEDRSRRNNLRTDSIEETTSETWQDCKVKIQELIKYKLKINKHMLLTIRKEESESFAPNNLSYHQV